LLLFLLVFSVYVGKLKDKKNKSAKVAIAEFRGQLNESSSGLFRQSDFIVTSANAPVELLLLL
jgi:hypothetical protein